MADPIVNIRNIIQGELGGFSKKTGGIWGEISRKTVEPSPQEKFHEFMNLPSEVRQQMVQQMGPEAYMEHVQKMLDIGSTLMGPAISGLSDFFQQDVQAATPQLPAPGVETYNPSNLDSLLQEQLGQMGDVGK